MKFLKPRREHSKINIGTILHYNENGLNRSITFYRNYFNSLLFLVGCSSKKLGRPLIFFSGTGSYTVSCIPMPELL
jgi:hypothetical protein